MFLLILCFFSLIHSLEIPNIILLYIAFLCVPRVIAEGPLASTARNLWKMIYSRCCGVVVMLSELVENGQVS